MKNLVFSLCFAFALSPAFVASQRVVEQRQGMDQLPPVLRQALRKGSIAKFSGTRIVEVMEGANRERYTEYVLRDGSKSRTWFPSGSPYAGQVIVEAADERRHYYPGRNEIHVGPARREEALVRLVGLGKRRGIKFAVKDGGNVAGRPTVLVSISEESGNALQKLWIDRDQVVILKRELFDAVGNRVGFFEFTEVDYRPKFSGSDFELERKGARVVTPRDELMRMAKVMNLATVALPESEGYRLEWVRRLPGGRVPILQQSYTKLGVTLSLFQAGAEVNLPMLRKVPNGIESLTWNRGGETFALIGNVSGDEIRRLARLLGYR